VGENTRGQDIKYSKLSAARRAALESEPQFGMNPYGEKLFAEQLYPQFDAAISVAENDPGRDGVFNSTNPLEDKELTVYKTFLRWIKNGKPGAFTDFLRDRYAPIGVGNDPKNRNQYWNDNVRKMLYKQLGPERYKEWESQNLVKAQAVGRNV